MNDPHAPSSVVDFNRLREVTGDNTELLADIAQQYLAQADEIMAELETAVKNLQMEDISRLAHKLSGSSATCGMNGIVGSLRQLEDLDSDARDEAATLFKASKQQLEQIRQLLTDSPSQNEPSTP